MDTNLAGDNIKNIRISYMLALVLFANCIYSPLSYSNPYLFNQLNSSAKKRVEAWEDLLKSPAPKNEMGILLKVNHFFNQLTFIPDTPLMGRADQWFTPYEFLINGGGDCEDFAIAKYFTAKSLGISGDKLRITYVTIKSRNQAHMILTYYPKPGAEPLILDNINKEILSASQRPDLQPVYSFTIEDVWLQQRMNKSSKYGNANSLSKWRALLKRFKEQSRLRNRQ